MKKVDFCPMSLMHVIKYVALLSDAGIEIGRRSPVLLPDYTSAESRKRRVN